MRNPKPRGRIPKYQVVMTYYRGRTVDSVPREEGDVFWVQDPLYTLLKKRNEIKDYDPPSPVEVVPEAKKKKEKA